MSKQQLLKNIQSALQAKEYEQAIPLCLEAVQSDLNEQQKYAAYVHLGNCYAQTQKVG